MNGHTGLTRQQRRAAERGPSMTPEAKAQRIASEIFSLRIAVGAASILLDRALVYMNGDKDPDHMPADTRAAIERFLAEWPVPPGAR